MWRCGEGIVMTVFFVVNDTRTSEIYTLSLHGALTISLCMFVCVFVCVCVCVHVHVHSVTRTLLLCWGLKVDLTIRASCSNAFAPTSGVFVLQFASKSMPY